MMLDDANLRDGDEGMEIEGMEIEGMGNWSEESWRYGKLKVWKVEDVGSWRCGRFKIWKFWAYIEAYT